jgi:uncharacterized protein YhaN
MSRPDPHHNRHTTPDTPPALDQRAYDTLSDLHACVLMLDAEQRQVAALLQALPQPGDIPPKRAELERRHAELTEELATFQAMIDRLRATIDPQAQFL